MFLKKTIKDIIITLFTTHSHSRRNYHVYSVPCVQCAMCTVCHVYSVSLGPGSHTLYHTHKSPHTQITTHTLDRTHFTTHTWDYRVISGRSFSNDGHDSDGDTYPLWRLCALVSLPPYTHPTHPPPCTRHPETMMHLRLGS